MDPIPATHVDLVDGSCKTFAHLATVMADGSPQNTPVWFEYRQGEIWINSAQGRVKDENMRKRPHVALLIADPENPYRYLQIRGHVAEITGEGAAEHIDQLSRQYTGRPFTIPPGQKRVIYRIAIDSVDAKS